MITARKNLALGSQTTPELRATTASNAPSACQTDETAHPTQDLALGMGQAAKFETGSPTCKLELRVASVIASKRRGKPSVMRWAGVWR